MRRAVKDRMTLGDEIRIVKSRARLIHCLIMLDGLTLIDRSEPTETLDTP